MAAIGVTFTVALQKNLYLLRFVWQQYESVHYDLSDFFLYFLEQKNKIHKSSGNWDTHWRVNGVFYTLKGYSCIWHCRHHHHHTVVWDWECCKEDQQSQWEMLNFDATTTHVPLKHCHRIWCGWLCHGYCSIIKKWAQSVKGLPLGIYTKYMPSCLLHYATSDYYFFVSFSRLHDLDKPISVIV